MKSILFCFGFFGILNLAHAGGSKHLVASVSYACLSLDGIPIAADSSLASQCCKDGQLVSAPPASCRVGISSIAPNAGASVAVHIKVAQNSLKAANELNGSDTDFTDKSPNKADTSAITSGGSGGPSVTGSGSGSGGEGTGGGMASAGTDGSGGGKAGAAGSGGDSGGLGMGSTSLGNGKSGAATGASGEAVGPNAAGGYVKGEGGAEADGKSGGVFGNFMGALGFGGHGGSGAGTGDLKEMKFGEEGGSGGSVKDDGSISGSPNDAMDYLSRIDKSANIFKVVSVRITKENIKKHVGE